MTIKPHYSPEQLQRLMQAHKAICLMRDVHPGSEDGRDLAARLLNECDGTETEAFILKRFIH